MDTSGSSNPGGPQEKMKAFISNALQYLQNHSDEILDALLRNLNFLEGVTDAAVFDTATILGSQFFMCLYELLNATENLCPLAWSIVSLLQKACTLNYSIQSHLRHTYQFTPFLARYLQENLTHEKKVKLLTLLQELTYGIHISWQNAYLAPMIRTLTAWVASGDPKVVSLSLGVLVNLLHRNPSVLHTFLGCVDVKNFMRKLVQMNGDTEMIEGRMEACKLMFLISDNTHNYPDVKEIGKLTFHTLINGARSGNTFFIQHCVDFFGDVAEISKYKAELLANPSYQTDAEAILKLLEEEQLNRSCEAVLIQFLHILVSIDPSNLSRFAGGLTNAALRSIEKDSETRGAALQLILVLVKEFGQKTSAESRDVLDLLVKGLPSLLNILKESSSVPRPHLITLLQLLREGSNIPSIQKAVLAELQPDVLRRLFEPLSADWSRHRNLPSVDDATMYVQTLSLISDFCSKDATWLDLYSLLLQQRCVQMALATALQTGPPPVKCLVLGFPATVGFPAQCCSVLAQCLGEIASNENCAQEINQASHADSQMAFPSPHDVNPVFAQRDKTRLNDVLSRVRSMVEKGCFTENTSDVIELFEFQLAADAHTERALLASLAAANDRVTHLTQRLHQTGDEMARLRANLLATQRTLERTREEREQALAATEKSESSAHHFRRERDAFFDRYKAEVEENDKKAKHIETLNKEIEKHLSDISTLKKEVGALEEENKHNLRQLTEKESAMDDLKERIRVLEVMRDAIYEISAGKKKLDK